MLDFYSFLILNHFNFESFLSHLIQVYIFVYMVYKVSHIYLFIYLFIFVIFNCNVFSGLHAKHFEI